MTVAKKFDWKSNGSVTMNGLDYARATTPERAKWIADCLNACEVFEDADPVAGVAELRESDRYRRELDAVWLRALTIAEKHLKDEVTLGQSYFDGIPKVVEERDALRRQLDVVKDERDGFQATSSTFCRAANVACRRADEAEKQRDRAIEEAASLREALGAGNVALLRRLRESGQRNVKLRDALQFYGDPCNYTNAQIEDGTFDVIPSKVEEDGGDKAREALEITH